MKSYATDTHPLVWYLSGKLKRLGKKARRVFERAEVGQAVIVVPAPVLMELLYLIEFKGLRLNFEDCLTEMELSDNYEIAPLDVDVFRAVRSVPLYIELYDRWIVATALARKLPLLTNDGEIIESKIVPVIW